MSLTGFLSYSRVNWQQSPSKSTPLSAANLNLMDAGIKNNNDMISNLRDEITQLNSNLVYDGIITANCSINADSPLFKKNKSVYIYGIGVIDGSIIEGFPENAYSFGMLLTFITDSSKYKSSQIYIPHSSSDILNRPIYIRTLLDGNGNSPIKNTWRMIKGDTINSY